MEDLKLFSVEYTTGIGQSKVEAGFDSYRDMRKYIEGSLENERTVTSISVGHFCMWDLSKHVCENRLLGNTALEALSGLEKYFGDDCKHATEGRKNVVICDGVTGEFFADGEFSVTVKDGVAIVHIDGLGGCEDLRRSDSVYEFCSKEFKSDLVTIIFQPWGCRVKCVDIYVNGTFDHIEALTNVADDDSYHTVCVKGKDLDEIKTHLADKIYFTFRKTVPVEPVMLAL